MEEVFDATPARGINDGLGETGSPVVVELGALIAESREVARKLRSKADRFDRLAERWESVMAGESPIGVAAPR